jgi:DNA-binding protein HU-beta
MRGICAKNFMEALMTKAELVKKLKEETGLATLAQAEAVYDKLFAIIGGSLQTGNDVCISGFGSFKMVKRAARKGRNPRTGKELQFQRPKP